MNLEIKHTLVLEVRSDGIDYNFTSAGGSLTDAGFKMTLGGAVGGTSNALRKAESGINNMLSYKVS